MERLLRIFLILLGAFLVLDALFVSQISNMNLGIIMPAVIGLPLLVLGIFYTPLTKFFASNLLGAIIKWGMISVYGLFTVLFTVTTTLILSAALQPPVPDADVLIVLGAGLRGDRISATLANRLDTASAYLSEYPDTICIVSGGLGEGETTAEAVQMKKYLVEHGIAADRVIEEAYSTSTYENFLFSNEIIKSEIGDDAVIAFVTTDFHIYRSTLTAHRAGVEAYGISSPGIWYITLNNYMRECAAIVQYTLTGKI